MSLPEKKPSPSLSQESYRTATVNMFFGVMLWAVIASIWATIDNLRNNKTSLAFDFVMLPMSFVILILYGIVVSIIPTTIGAKVLCIWLQRSHVTQKSSLIAGAAIGAIAISSLTIPVCVFGEIMRFHGIASFIQSVILQLAIFNLPIAVCAALAGGRTGLQLAKFMETQNQNPVELGRDLPTLTETSL